MLLLLLQPHIHLKKEIKHEEFKSTNKTAFKVEVNSWRTKKLKNECNVHTTSQTINQEKQLPCNNKTRTFVSQASSRTCEGNHNIPSSKPTSQTSSAAIRERNKERKKGIESERDREGLIMYMYM